MLSRLTGAIVRATLVAWMIVLPTLMLPSTSADTAFMASFVALCAAFLTIVEYNSAAPSLIEFRDAPPFNRIRFFGLFTLIVTLAMLARDAGTPGSITQFANIATNLLDMAFSPVHLMILVLPEQMSQTKYDLLRHAVAMAYLISVLSVAVFAVLLRVIDWPKRNSSFNFWVNLPTFDPLAKGNMSERLRRSATVNAVFGFLFPFVIPALATVLASDALLMRLADPHSMIWFLVLWAYVPAGLLMRCVALLHVAHRIEDAHDTTAKAEAKLSTA